MSELDAKKHAFRVIYRHSPETSDAMIAKALGRDESTIRRWRRQLREQSIQVKADTCHCLKVLDRA
jgi:transposase-like protein